MWGMSGNSRLSSFNHRNSPDLFCLNYFRTVRTSTSSDRTSTLHLSRHSGMVRTDGSSPSQVITDFFGPIN